MVLKTTWKECIQAGKMKMAPNAIHTLILLWKSVQMLTWKRTCVIQFAKDQKILKSKIRWYDFCYHHNMKDDKEGSIF